MLVLACSPPRPSLTVPSGSGPVATTVRGKCPGINSLISRISKLIQRVKWSESQVNSTEVGLTVKRILHHQLGAVHKLRHPFLDHFRHPTPPCHHVICYQSVIFWRTPTSSPRWWSHLFTGPHPPTSVNGNDKKWNKQAGAELCQAWASYSLPDRHQRMLKLLSTLILVKTEQLHWG